MHESACQCSVVAAHTGRPRHRTADGLCRGPAAPTGALLCARSGAPRPLAARRSRSRLNGGLRCRWRTHEPPEHADAAGSSTVHAAALVMRSCGTFARIHRALQCSCQCHGQCSAPSHKTMHKTGPTHGDGPTTSSAQKYTGPARANLRRATQAKERAEARAQESVSRLRGGGSLSPRSLGALPLSLLSASSHP